MATLMASLPSSHNSCSRAPCSAPSPSFAFSPKRLPERRRFDHTLRRNASSRGFSMWNISNNVNTEEGITPHVEMEAIANEDNFNSALSAAQQQSKPIVIDWMASWCRKCIYLKPKLAKLATEFKSDVKFYYVDVNTVPQALVKRAEVTKMPTIQVWKNGEKCGEVIGGQKAWLVVDEVRDMVQKHLR